MWALKRGPLIYPVYTRYNPRAHTSEPFKGGKGPYQGPLQLPIERPRQHDYAVFVSVFDILLWAAPLDLSWELFWVKLGVWGLRLRV